MSASGIKPPSCVPLVNSLSLDSNGGSDRESNDSPIREDVEITLDQADAWGFGNRSTNQPAGVRAMSYLNYVLYKQ